MKVKTFALLLTAALLCGCGKQIQTAAELPEDTPYNRSIMETENGFYTNYGIGMFLRFYERDTENQIFLCAKPECLHDGSESCVATYKNLDKINTVLYDGALYILTLEIGDTVELSLYKAALDGTSLTKVGDVLTVSNSAEEKDIWSSGNMYFIIHKGYAYIPYHITLGHSSFGFAGGGLVKMNISDGSSEQLYTCKDYFSPTPKSLQGSGDHVYFTMIGNNDKDIPRGFYDLDINTGEYRKISDLDIVVGERKFFTAYKEENGLPKIYSCDKETGENGISPDKLTAVTEEFEVSKGYYIDSIISYRDVVIVAHGGKLLIYNENGGKLGEIVYAGDTENFDHTGTYKDGIAVYDGMYFSGFAVSDDKIYLTDSYYYSRIYDEQYNDKYDEVVYSCPIEDVINGTGKWKFEYGVINPYYIKNGIER